MFKHRLAQFLGFFPRPLPTKGIEALEAFTENILQTYDLPNKPSYHHAIATMILHLDPRTSRCSLAYFARSVRKAMANEIAFEKIERLKEEFKKQEATKTTETPNGLSKLQGPAETLVPKTQRVRVS